MLYVIDGYNVTKRDTATTALPLAGQREALVARLAVRGEDLLGRGDIVIVFDGVSGRTGEERRGSVRVRYARGESADEAIVRLAGPDVTVVTSDGDLARRVQTRGARVLGAEQCFEERKAKRGRRIGGSTAGLPKGANKITQELKDLWLGGEE